MIHLTNGQRTVKGWNTNDQQTYEKVLNITSHWRNPNKNHKEVSPHLTKKDYHQKKKKINAG